MNRFNYFAENKKVLQQLFHLEDDDEVVDRSCRINVIKQVTYVVSKQKQKAVESLETQADPVEEGTPVEKDEWIVWTQILTNVLQ